MRLITLFLYPRYEVYRGYIVFAFSVIMFVCLSVCLFVCKLFFFVKDFSATTWVRILKFGTRLDSDELYCVTKEQPHIAYQSLYLFIFLSLQWKNFSSKISQQLLGLGFWNLVQSLIVMSCIVLQKNSHILLISPFICSFFFLSNGNFCHRFLSSYWNHRFQILCTPSGRQSVLCKCKLSC